MKFIYVSQRVDINTDYGERRDALDQRWAKLLWHARCIAMPLFNHRETVLELLKVKPPDGILLSGGSSVPERNETDVALIEHAIQNKIPLLGICLGMQSIVLYFGGSLCEVKGHVAVRHKLDCGREVNSYHEMVIDRLPQVLEAKKHSVDGTIECICHEVLPFIGIMWHPEREGMFDKQDIDLIREMFHS